MTINCAMILLMSRDKHGMTLNDNNKMKLTLNDDVQELIMA